jgi:ATP synthase protein I
MQEGPDPGRLKKLEDRIEDLKRANTPPAPVVKDFRAADMGWRMVIELVSGMGIGFGIGYGLDVLIGTLPVFLVLFTLLGFAAGVRVMLRTAREFQEKTAAGQTRQGEGD